MNEKEKRNEFEQKKEVETVFCTKSFNAETSRLTDTDSPCEITQEK